MNSKLKLSGRLVTIVLSIISIIAFFLPLASYSAKNGSKTEVFMRYTGYKWLKGFSETVSVSGYGSIRFEEPGTKVALMLIICPIIILLVSFLKNMKQKTYGLIITICSVINALIWLLMKLVFSETAKDMGSDVKALIGSGFTLVFISSGLLIALGIMVCKKGFNIDSEVTNIQSLTAGADKLSSVNLSKMKDAASKMDVSSIKNVAAKVDLASIKNAVSSFELPSGNWTCVCGNVVSGGKFCPKCGLPKPVAPKCPKCGAKVMPDDMFCKSCGSRLDKSETVVEATQTESVAINEQPKVDTIIDPIQATEPTCPSCGATVKKSYAFCLKCGAALTGNDEDAQEKVTSTTTDDNKNKKILMLVGIIVIVIVGVFLIKLIVGKTKDKAELNEPEYIVEEDVPADDRSELEKAVEDFLDEEIEKNKLPREYEAEAPVEEVPAAEAALVEEASEAFGLVENDGIFDNCQTILDMQIGEKWFYCDGSLTGGYTYSDFIQAFDAAGIRVDYELNTYGWDSYNPDWRAYVYNNPDDQTRLEEWWVDDSTGDCYIVYIARDDILSMEKVGEDDRGSYVKGVEYPVAAIQIMSSNGNKVLRFEGRPSLAK